MWSYLAQVLKIKQNTLKKFLIFPQKKTCLIFRENGTLILWEIELLSQAEKIKNIHPRKNSYISGNGTF